MHLDILSQRISNYLAYPPKASNNCNPVSRFDSFLFGLLQRWLAHSFYNNRKSAQNLSTASNLIATNKQTAFRCVWRCMTLWSTSSSCTLIASSMELATALVFYAIERDRWYDLAHRCCLFVCFLFIRYNSNVFRCSFFHSLYANGRITFRSTPLKMHTTSSAIHQLARDYIQTPISSHLNNHRLPCDFAIILPSMNRLCLVFGILFFVLFFIIHVLRLHTTRSITHYA